MPSSRHRRGVTLVVGYAVVAVAPLVLAIAGQPPSTGFVEDLAFVSGLLGFALLGLQFLTVARSRYIADPFGVDIVMRFHQQMSFVAVAFLLAHPLLLVYARGRQVVLSPDASVLPGQLALVLVVGLIGVAVLRLRLGLSYELWRITHGLAAVVLMLAAAAHVLAVGRWIAEPWQQWLFVLFTGVVVGAYGEIRVVRPLRQRRRPWRVRAVEQVGPEAWTVDLGADRHDGLRFHAGQFAWVRFAESPFGIVEHPFSFTSSAADPCHLRFTIKELGDDTSRIGRLQVGARAYVDGPFGSFRLDRYPADRVLLVAGGVGVAPVLSILRTMADAGDDREVVLIVANDREVDILHRTELDDLAERLRLKIVHVLSHPDEGWGGEEGHVDAPILRRHLPSGCWEGLQCFVCGPPPMMDAVIDDLRGLGTPSAQIHQEVFDFV